MTLLGLMVVVVPHLFVLSFLSGGLSLLLWWVNCCYVDREPLRVILWWATEGLALVTILSWGVLVVREFSLGL